jgi:hypothetical protein
VFDHERASASAAAGLDESWRASSLPRETSHDLVHEGKARHRVVRAEPLLLQVRGNRIPAAPWYEQKERHTPYLTALSSITSHHITSHHLTHTLRVDIPLASNEKSNSRSSCETNTCDRKSDTVSEKKCANTVLDQNTRLTWQAANCKNQKLDAQLGWRVGTSSLSNAARVCTYVQ